MADRIKMLMQTRWYDATVARWKAHREACRNVGCPYEPFHRFADEVLNTPEKNRDSMLAFEPIENYEPFRRFAQYQAPRAEEMILGTSRKKKG